MCCVLAAALHPINPDGQNIQSGVVLGLTHIRILTRNSRYRTDDQSGVVLGFNPYQDIDKELQI